MNGHTFATLPPKEKEKIVRSAIRAANKDQKELVKSSKKALEKTALGGRDLRKS